MRIKGVEGALKRRNYLSETNHEAYLAEAMSKDRLKDGTSHQ